MQLRTTYPPSLIIGISILILSNSCKKERIEIGLQSATYTYYNTFSDFVRIEIYDIFSQSSSEYTILPFDSISFIEKQEGLTYPFRGSLPESINGDSVVIRFKDKCTIYRFDNSSGTYGGNGVFDLTEYDNYSLDLSNQKSYELFYSIDSIDYKRGSICN